MTTNSVGELAEIKAATAFAETGNVVSFPFGDEGYYDLIRDDGELHRVQVKNARLKEGAIEANLHTRYQKEGGWVSTTYTSDEIDEFAIYCPDTDSVYRIGVEEAPTWSVRFRVDDIENESPQTKWVEDYEVRK